MSKRVDKRAPADLRPVKVTPDYLLTAEGSVLIVKQDPPIAAER